MAERVGKITYDVELNTATMIRGQREVDAAVGRTSASLDSLSGALNYATKAISLYSAALAVVKSATMADDMRLLAARVQVAAGSMQAGAQAMVELNAIAQRTQTSVAANASTFGRLNQSLVEMGGTQSDTLQVTELLAKAIKVSGASSVEASSAMLQFGQALGSGKLAGDELRSLMENAPYLMRQLADGLGVPIGALKKMGEEGELTSDKVIKALFKASEQINKDFSTFPQTVESAFQLMQDAATRANQKFDEMSGTSIMLTGANKGLAEVLDKLAEQFGAANDEAGKLGRNEAIKDWTEKSKVAFSYLVDAVDVTWQALSVFGRNVAFVFEGVGTEIGGIAAQVAAVARGDFAQAKAIGDMMEADAAARRARLDAADAKTLARVKTAGQQMREAWDAGAGGGRGFVNPAAAGTKGKFKDGNGNNDDKGNKSKAAPFDAAGYLAGLEAQAADAWTRIGIIEEQAMRKAGELRDKGRISAAQHAQAVKLIEANAAQDRQQILFDDATARLEIIAQAGEKETEARKRARDLMDSVLKEAMSPAERLRLEEAEKLVELEAALEADLALRGKYELAKQALRDSTAAKLKEIDDKEQAEKQAAEQKQLQAYGQMFDGMAGIVESFAGKQNAAYKVLFAASKAFAVAESIIKIQQGIANASALPFPANLGAMATVAAQTAGIVSTIKGTSYGGGRQYGGAVQAGTMYKVNETGAPEMFQGANGSQYMMPNKSGQVVPANQIGGRSAPNIVVNNMAGGSATASARYDSRTDTTTITVSEVANQIRSRSGPIWNALKTTNVQGRLD